ncbi:MAG: pcaD [Ramlibacter sp.]|jgi:3-oxoadipate enol-lactonase|nr:pcaD [Ramlibacter sp.]
MSAAGLRKVRVGQQDIACRIDGPAQGPAVLLVHGVLTDHRAWDAVAARLASKFRVVRYDLRGHGGSSAPPPPYTMEELADDVAGLLDVLQIDQVHLAGSSLGGMIGQQVGARHGHRLLSLTLANTGAVQAAPAAWDERAAIARKSGVAALAEGTLQRWFTPGFIEKSPDEIDRMRRILCEVSVDGYVGCAAAIRDLSQLALLTRIGVPTLVIAGSQDQATPPAQAQQIADAIPGARLVTLPAAHQAAVEQPQAFCDAWLSFVDSQGS